MRAALATAVCSLVRRVLGAGVDAQGHLRFRGIFFCIAVGLFVTPASGTALAFSARDYPSFTLKVFGYGAAIFYRPKVGQGASTEAVASTSGVETIGVRFATANWVSVREQFINTNIFHVLLRDKASKQQDVRPCRLIVESDDQFPNLRLTASHASPTQRGECLRALVRYILHETIEEADFLSARELEAESTSRWREPNPRYLGLAEGASERLAYLAIYQPGSPLHDIYSITAKEFSDLSFNAFTGWLRRNREQGLISFYGKSSTLQFLNLPVGDPMELIGSVSLFSPRNPPGILYFDGEKFGIAAVLMVSLGLDQATRHLRKSNLWNRFLCNRDSHSQRDDRTIVAAITNVTCFSYNLYGMDSWLGLAIRKSANFDYADFCRQVKNLAHDDDLLDLVSSAPEKSKGLYILLPPECRSKD